MHDFPIKGLKNWFFIHRRDLPWREDPTPYKVWISEMMLQQTQVSVVTPYFERWMREFPTVTELARAPLEKVLKSWEGLGYYTRARHIHEAARYLVEYHQGHLPSNLSDLSRIKGIGPYTQGAILSFAFHQKRAAIDGNVLRVISRFQGIEEPIHRVQTKRQIQHYVETILPDFEPWIVSEALIELGAMVCMKKPICTHCPLKNGCFAYRHNRQDQLPKKSQRVKVTQLKRDVAVITKQNKVLLCKNRPGEIMGDLYEFPYLEHSHLDVKKRFEAMTGCELNEGYRLPEQEHTFTRFRARLFPYVFSCMTKGTCSKSEFIWKSIEEIEKLPFSSGHRRILFDSHTFFSGGI